MRAKFMTTMGYCYLQQLPTVGSTALAGRLSREAAEIPSSKGSVSKGGNFETKKKFWTVPLSGWFVLSCDWQAFIRISSVWILTPFLVGHHSVFLRKYCHLFMCVTDRSFARYQMWDSVSNPCIRLSTLVEKWTRSKIYSCWVPVPETRLE